MRVEALGGCSGGGVEVGVVGWVVAMGGGES